MKPGCPSAANKDSIISTPKKSKPFSPIIGAITAARLNSDLSIEFFCGNQDKHEKSDNTETQWYSSDKLIETPETILAYLINAPSITLNALIHSVDPVVKALVRVAQHKMAFKALIDAPKSLELFVKTLNGETTTLNVSSQIKVISLKRLVQNSEGTPPDQQRLVFSGRQLQDGLILEDYNIMNHSTIHMVFKLRGRKPVIYLYPLKVIDGCKVVLRLAPFWTFAHHYPRADKRESNRLEWNVTVYPSGGIHLRDLTVPYLFWEAEVNGFGHPNLLPLNGPHIMTLARSRFIPYLECVLGHLYLDHQQRADFITYWLGTISTLNFVKFRFAKQCEINYAAPLNIKPVPEILFRVFLIFGEGAAPSGLASHQIPHPAEWLPVVSENKDMKGWKESKFSALEWGGMFYDPALFPKQYDAVGPTQAVPRGFLRFRRCVTVASLDMELRLELNSH